MMDLRQLLMNIGEDLLEPIGYLPWGILAGVFALAVWKVIHRNRLSGVGNDQKKVWVYFLCVIYGTVFLELAFFYREPGSRTGVDLQILGTWGESAVSRAYFVENILLFIPFGILAPLAIFRFRRRVWCVTVGCLCSVCLEIMQLLTQRGYCQLDDVLTNTLGTWIGWEIWRFLRKFIEKRKIFR